MSFLSTQVCVCVSRARHRARRGHLQQLSLFQENPQGGKRDLEDDSASRTSKGDRLAEPVQNPEQRQARAAHAPQAGPCVSLQPSHTDLDSDVSDDTDQELDIEEDDDELTLKPGL